MRAERQVHAGNGLHSPILVASNEVDGSSDDVRLNSAVDTGLIS
jgi:hypothetical protein